MFAQSKKSRKFSEPRRVAESETVSPLQGRRNERSTKRIGRTHENGASYGAAAALEQRSLLMAAARAAHAAGKKVCYAFQDLSTGFWGAGHAAIVDTLTEERRRGDRAERRQGRQPPARTGQGLHRAGCRRHHPDRRRRRFGDHAGRARPGSRRADRDLQPPAVGPVQRHHRRRRQRVGRAAGRRGDGGPGRGEVQGDRQEAPSVDPRRRPRRSRTP